MKKTGTIEALNVSPKGFYEGFLLKTGTRIAQINLPKEKRESASKHLKPGEKITVEVEHREPRGEPVHEVYQLVRMLGSNGDFKSDKHRTQRFSGVVGTLNYALHGEINGGILDSGDFLHLKPEGARILKVKAGMHVEGRGKTRPMVDGHAVIEAKEVNGIEMQGHKAKKKQAAKHSKR
jgi:hypothetical protein